MAESKEQQPRNAAAGQRQKEYAKDQRQETARAFGKQGLTRKNEEFMFQLNKQLDAQGADPAKKPAMLEETLKALQEGQKTGQTARGLFGTPTQRAHALLHPEPTEQSQTQSSLKLMALDLPTINEGCAQWQYGDHLNHHRCHYRWDSVWLDR